MFKEWFGWIIQYCIVGYVMLLKIEGVGLL